MPTAKATQRVRFALPKGPVAAPARAWGEEFDVVIGGNTAEKPFETEGDMAVISIKGQLVQHAHWLFANYDDIRTKVAAACESGLGTICLRINSPGGDFAGALELSREIRAMGAAAGKRIVTYTDSQALSAGYALACAGEEIVITESAFVGSIGVWAALCDETARDRAMGLNVVIVPSGSQKAERNPHVAITEDAVAHMQVQVDDMASMFFDLVAEQRGLARSKIEALQGSEQFGSRAISLGLADRIVNGWSEFIGKGQVMAKSTKEARSAYREALAKLAAGDDDDAKEARASLSAMDKEDEKKEAKAEGDDEKKKDGDEEKASASASDEGDKKEEEKKAAAASPKLRVAASSTQLEIDLAARVQALESERAEEKLEAKRAALLASRPDFAPEVKAVLACAPLEVVENAVKNFKRIASPTKAASEATTPGGTRGVGQVDGEVTTGFVGQETELQFIDRKMGLAKASGGITRQGTSLELGYMTPDQVQAASAKLNAEKGAN